MKRFGHVFIAVGVLLSLGLGAAQALDAEQRCLRQRERAAGQFNNCIQQWLAKLESGWDVQPLPFQSTKRAFKALSGCRRNYFRRWPMFGTRYPGTTCDQPRFEDNGNGTMTDHLSGLVWEKKGANGGIHDLNTFYRWSTNQAMPPVENGSAFTSFLSTLNSSQFGGSSGWRIPTFAELQTIGPASREIPCPLDGQCVPEGFDQSCTPGCTELTCNCIPAYLWSRTRTSTASEPMWRIDSNGIVEPEWHDLEYTVRAVRAGL